MAYQIILHEFMQIPPVTRSYISTCILTTLAVQLDIVTPYQLYFNPELIFKNFQIWRLITNFCYFGPIGFNFLFNILFTYRYSRFLEEGSFRGKTADFFYMFLFGGFLITIMAFFCEHNFLGQCTYNHVCLCLGQTQSIHKNEFFWVNEFSSAISSLGFVWIFGSFRRLIYC